MTCPYCKSEKIGGNERCFVCQSCRGHWAERCFKCGTRDGFPRYEPRISEAEADRSPIVVSATDVQRERRGIVSKSRIYCELCFHNHYFIKPGDPNHRCLLCGTEWNRLGPAKHNIGILA